MAVTIEWFISMGHDFQRMNEPSVGLAFFDEQMSAHCPDRSEFKSSFMQDLHLNAAGFTQHLAYLTGH